MTRNPEAKYHNIAVKPPEMQKEMVASLAERAEQVRGGGVDSSVDNMLKITNDGRKLALDQRMLNDMLPDFEGSKINACVDNIYRIWKENADKKSAQLVFCDLSTPKNDGTFSVYNDIRKKLIERGIPESEVKFIHEADTDMKKKNCSKRPAREKSGCFLALLRRWEQERMYRTNLSHFTTWIVRGDLQM